MGIFDADLIYNPPMPNQSQNRERKLTSFLLLVCILFITCGYYLFHKPVTPEVATAIGTGLWRLVIVLLIITLAGAIGRKLFVPLEEAALSATVLQAGLGLGLISVYLLLIGSTAGINWMTLALIPVVTGIGLWKSLIGWVQTLAAALSMTWRKTNQFEKVIAFLIGVVLLSTLVVSLAPPIQYDALMYHLVLPQQYVAQGKISHIPWLVMTGMPQTTEMLYTLAVGLGGLPTAAVMGWAVGLLSILGIIGFFQNSDSRLANAGWVASACLLAGETFSGSLSWAYVDWTSLFFGVCAVTTLRSWMENPSSKSIILTGIFAGLSFAVKYTGGILALCCVMVVVVQMVTKKSETGRWNFQPFLWFSGAALLFPAVWLLRNAILTGNPLYPFFFPAAEMDAVRISVYQGAGSFGEWWEGFALPIRATIWGAELGMGYSVSIGALLLALALCNLAGRTNPSPGEKNALKMSLIMVLSGWLFWAVGNRVSGYLIQTRMYYSIFPSLAILAALGWKTISEVHFSGVRFSRVVGAIVLLTLGLSALNVLVKSIQTDAIRYVVGLKSETAYLDDILGWYAPAMRAVKSMPSGGRTLFFYEPRGLACIPSCDPDEILDQWKISQKGNPDTNSVLESWKQQGFEYVLLNIAGMRYLEAGTDPHHPADEVRLLRETVKDLKVVETFGNSYQVYKLP